MCGRLLVRLKWVLPLTPSPCLGRKGGTKTATVSHAGSPVYADVGQSRGGWEGCKGGLGPLSKADLCRCLGARRGLSLCLRTWPFEGLLVGSGLMEASWNLVCFVVFGKFIHLLNF